jgi:hypothetical protein
MIRRLTNGPLHHFYGYYGICPWNSTNQFTPLAETSAFNFQQGSMMHWINAGAGEEFTFNDWEGDRLVSRAINPETGAQRTLDGAIAVVSPHASIGVGLNFARMSACRRVVGYANELYKAEYLSPIPNDDGLFHIDLKTGRSELLISIADVYGLLPYSRQPHWFNHVVCNPGGTRLLFFSRVKLSKKHLTSVWVANTDGTELQCLIDYGHSASHFAWYDDDSVMISSDTLGSMQFVSMNTRSKDIASMEIDSFPSDGHNAFSADYRWVVCDTYPEGPHRESRLLLHNRKTLQTRQLGSFAHPACIRGDWRCDLHPRWSRDGKIITFDSVHEGTRQIYAVDLSSIVQHNSSKTL